MRSFMLAAFAALAALAPSSAFVATTSPRATATAGQRYRPSSAPRAAPAARINVAAPLRMMSGADTAVEQKGLVTVYHKETCPYCKKVGGRFNWKRSRSERQARFGGMHVVMFGTGMKGMGEGACACIEGCVCSWDARVVNKRMSSQPLNRCVDAPPPCGAK